MLLKEYDNIVSPIEKYIVMIMLLWDFDLKDNLIVKLVVFLVFYYFDDIIFKYWKNKCIYNSFNIYIFGQNNTSIRNVMGNDHCLKILAEFTSHMYVYIVVSFVWLDHHYWLIWYLKKMYKNVIEGIWWKLCHE